MWFAGDGGREWEGEDGGDACVMGFGVLEGEGRWYVVGEEVFKMRACVDGNTRGEKFAVVGAGKEDAREVVGRWR